MSTMKFMTATGSNRELHIKRSNEDHVQIRQFDPEFHTHQAKTFFLNPSEAPALALAILEAAGCSEEYEGGNCWAGPLGQAMHMLRLETEAQERAIAEARERAELEAEALELRNAFTLAIGGRSIDSFAEHSVNKPGWIDAARRARELAKEATK